MNISKEFLSKTAIALTMATMVSGCSDEASMTDADFAKITTPKLTQKQYMQANLCISMEDAADVYLHDIFSIQYDRMRKAGHPKMDVKIRPVVDIKADMTNNIYKYKDGYYLQNKYSEREILKFFDVEGTFLDLRDSHAATNLLITEYASPKGRDTPEFDKLMNTVTHFKSTIKGLDSQSVEIVRSSLNNKYDYYIVFDNNFYADTENIARSVDEDLYCMDYGLLNQVEFDIEQYKRDFMGKKGEPERTPSATVLVRGLTQAYSTAIRQAMNIENTRFSSDDNINLYSFSYVNNDPLRHKERYPAPSKIEQSVDNLRAGKDITANSAYYVYDAAINRYPKPATY